MAIPEPAVDLPPSIPAHADGVTRAYQSCVNLQNAMLEPEQTKNRIAARVLGYFLLYPFDADVCLGLARDINACTDQEALVELGMVWWDNMLRIFRIPRTPSPLIFPFRTSGEDQEQFQAMVMQTEHTDLSVVKAQALTRDGFRCVLTGKYDEQAVEHGWFTLPASVEPSSADLATLTDVCHIVPRALVHWLKDQEQWPPHADFKGSLLNGLQNAFTVDKIWHVRFNLLRCYLEETETTNIYRLKVIFPPHLAQLPDRIIDLRSNDPLLPAPCAKLLAIHRTCAIVAQLSGAWQWMETHPEEDEDPLVWSGGFHMETRDRDAFAKALSGRLRGVEPR